MTQGTRAGVWGEPLLHPVSLLSMAVWWLNDHVGKLYVPSVVTGKASDVACLIVFPLWAWCLVDGVASYWLPQRYRANRALRERCLYAVTAAVCVWFALINVSDVYGAIHRDLWSSIYGVVSRHWAQVGGYWNPVAHHTVDAGDLSTLPAALLGVWIGRAWLMTGRSPQQVPAPLR